MCCMADIVLLQDNNVASSLKPVDSVTHRFSQTLHYASDKGSCLMHTFFNHGGDFYCFYTEIIYIYPLPINLTFTETFQELFSFIH